VRNEPNPLQKCRQVAFCLASCETNQTHSGDSSASRPGAGSATFAWAAPRPTACPRGTIRRMTQHDRDFRSSRLSADPHCCARALRPMLGNGEGTAMAPGSQCPAPRSETTMERQRWHAEMAGSW
jgi:hypothetical protein